MSLNIEAGVVWKPRNRLRTVVSLVTDHQESANLKTVMMRVLSRFPEASQAVIQALEQMGGEPWRPLPEQMLPPSLHPAIDNAR